MEKNPNILLITVDHWPAHLLGSAGHPVILSPTLDYLTRAGIRYENTYSECPICIPARRTLMTGMTPRNHGDRVFSETMPMPDAATLAGCFRDAGYQAQGVGKLHVHPQRNRIGFDDMVLMEEARYQFGVVDDYQMALAEAGFAGDEFRHGLGNNRYETRPWHLDEKLHPTVWATSRMIQTIKRRDPTRPGFWFLSYIYPHPPLVPLESYQEMYTLSEIDKPISGDWNKDEFPVNQKLRATADEYSDKEIKMARRAFYAQCTLIDHQIRNVIGTLREEGVLDDTILMFTCDHGDMLFDHGMVAKRVLYDNSARVPLILAGKPVMERMGQDAVGSVDSRIVGLQDVMPTLLDLAEIPVPDSVDGISMVGEGQREYLYGEVEDNIMATRMIRNTRYKLLWYPAGNRFQLFDMLEDPRELNDIYEERQGSPELVSLLKLLRANLYGRDEEWVDGERFIGMDAPPVFPVASADISLNNQRGGHWPPPIRQDLKD